jgi:hypothetical protein
MNLYVLPFVCSAAVVALRSSSASTKPPTSVNHASNYVGYLQQDADSGVQTESDSDGNYDVFHDRLASDGRWFNDDDYDPDIAHRGHEDSLPAIGVCRECFRARIV